LLLQIAVLKSLVQWSFSKPKNGGKVHCVCWTPKVRR